MEDTDRLVLYRWTLADLGSSGLREPLRAAEALLVGHIAPALRDPRIREHAPAAFVQRWHETQDHRISVAVAAPPEAADSVTATAGSHLAPSGDWQHSVADADPILHPAFRDYLRGLGEITSIALDLSGGSEHALRAHQCFLVRLCCAPADPRFELHPYLLEHSPSYMRHGALRENHGTWPWEHEEFWARCYTPGPSLEFQAPLRFLWNIVLGVNPRRRDDPRSLASRIGIVCPETGRNVAH